MQRSLALLLNCLIFSAGLLHAQQVQPRLTTLSLSSLDGFVDPPSNWKIMGEVNATFWDTALSTSPGSQILFNDYNRTIQYASTTHLFTKMEHGDVVLELDFMIPKGSNSGIYLQSRYEIQIADSWGVQLPKHSDVGGIYERWDNGKGFEGKAPMKNAGFAPGLWNHLEISFQAPRFDATGKKTAHAKFVYVKLNGVVLHENILVSGPTRAAAFEHEVAHAPLMIQGDHGQIAIRNIRYAPQEELNVSLNNIQYAYYEQPLKGPAEAQQYKPAAQGPATAIDARLAAARDKYFLSFNGTLTVPANDTYTFTLRHSGDASLVIDGKAVIGPTWNHLGGYPITGSSTLSKGTHPLQLWVSKDLNWSSSGIALAIEKPNSKAVTLNSPASIPERVPDPLIQVKAERQTELVRSFLYHHGKKLTHVMSVGHPSNIHYSYDLLQGGLLQVWKGDFLNTTDMWYERGEPQTASSMGATIVLKGNCPIYDKTATKDSVPAYTYKGYTLDKTGAPTFRYTYHEMEIQDLIRPLENSRGLSRTLMVNKAQNDQATIRLAQANSIVHIKNDVYSVDNGKYFIQVAEGTKPTIEAYRDQYVMILPAAEKMEYRIIW